MKQGKAARLREKRMLKMREARRLRELRKKLPKGVMGDFMKWGFKGMQSLQEKPWYQKQLSDASLGALKGETGSPDANEIFKNQHQILEDLTQVLGFKTDLHHLFPWVVLRDGELYYRFHPSIFVKENYSFN